MHAWQSPEPIPSFAVPANDILFAAPPLSPVDLAFGIGTLGAGALPCNSCGGRGARVPTDRVYCSECRWLRPLSVDYVLPVESYLWRLDADAMNVLRSLGPLTMAAHAVSERVGRPWFEASVNGLRLSEKQLPEIFAYAIRAARTLGLQYLPELYISGDQMWDANTLGTDTNAFIVLGSVLINFKEDELLFVFGREMGRVRAGHALWRTVTQLLTGRARHRSILGDGVLRLLNPARIAESALDAPLMAWSRHSEITADRAGMLCVADAAIARRVLTTWTLKSFPLQSRINAEAWQEQELAVVGAMTQLSEWTLSSTPYLAGRLRLLAEFVGGAQWIGWRKVIEHWLPPLAAARPPEPSVREPRENRAPPPNPDTVRLVCPSCHEGMRVPRSAVAGSAPVNVRCPNPACRLVLTVTPKPQAEKPQPDDPSTHSEA